MKQDAQNASQNAFGASTKAASQSSLRRYERCEIQAPIACIRDEGLAFETVVEISEGGLLMLVSHDYKIGEIMDLRFFIPGHVSIEIRGEIAYLMDSVTMGPSPARHAGVRFLEAPETLAPSIRSYILKIKSGRSV